LRRKDEEGEEEERKREEEKICPPSTISGSATAPGLYVARCVHAVACLVDQESIDIEDYAWWPAPRAPPADGAQCAAVA